MDSQLRLKIKTLDNSVALVECPQNYTVQQLKGCVQEKTGVPVSRQRLIFQGRLMDDSDVISKYNIQEDFVVHLVAHSVEQNNQLATTDQSQEPRTESTVQELIESTQSITNDLEMLSGILRTLRQTTFNRQNLRRVILQQRGNGFAVDRQASLETIRQNFENIQQMMDCQLTVNELHPEDYKNKETFVNPFKLQNRKFKIGQWIDLKDTIDQWLEAQIIDIRENQLLAHYNGWDRRWDEWLDFDSPRIALFRTYTVGSATQDFMSPVPVNEPESTGLNHPTPLEMHEFVFDVGFAMNKMTAMLIEFGKYQNFRKLKEKQLQLMQQKQRISQLTSQQFEETKDFSDEEVREDELRALQLKSSLMSSQLGPLFDRMGRMMVDLAPHFAMMGSATQTIQDQNSYPTHVFQVPVMLTPSELNQTQVQSNLLFNGNAFDHINTRIGQIREFMERQTRTTESIRNNLEQVQAQTQALAQTQQQIQERNPPQNEDQN